MKTKLILLMLGLGVATMLNASPAEAKHQSNGKEAGIASKVDSLIANMSTHDKVAQLFVISLSSNNTEATKARQDSLVKSGIGALILMRGSVTEFMERVNTLQGYARIPLLVSIDGEWGPAMRFTEYLEYPHQYELGHLDKAEKLLYRMGVNVGKDLRDLNVLINLAPDVDVAAAGVSTGARSDSRLFSTDPEKVTSYATAYARGMQDAGINACAKHFMGCRKTGVDAHYELPTYTVSREYIDSVDLRPYRSLFANGVKMVMMNHVSVPCIDDSGIPMSISKKGVTGLLKNELGFDGIVMTDALRMDAIAKYYTAVESNIMAYRAGIDMMLMPADIPQTIKALTDSIECGAFPMSELDDKVRKILTLKEKSGYFEPGFDATVTDVDKKIATARKRDSRLIRKMTRKLIKCGYGEPVKNWNDPTLVLDRAGK